MLRQMKGFLPLFFFNYNFYSSICTASFFNPQDTCRSGVQKALPEGQMLYSAQQMPNFSEKVPTDCSFLGPGRWLF